MTLPGKISGGFACACFAGLALTLSVPQPAGAKPPSTAEWEARVTRGRALLSEGKKAEAAREARAALEESEERFGPEASRTADALELLAEVYMAQGKRSRATSLLERALAIRQETLKPDDPILAKKMIVVARIYAEEGLMEKAAGLAERALALQEGSGQRGQPVVADTLVILADVYLAAGETGPARKAADQALKIRRDRLPPKDPLVVETLVLAAKVRLTVGETVTAETLYREALAIQKEAGGVENPHLTALRSRMEKEHAGAGNPKPVTSREAFEEPHPDSLRSAEMERGEAGLSIAMSLHHRGQAFAGLGRNSQAEELYGQALELYDKILGPDDSRTLEFLKDYAGFLDKTGRKEKARKLRERIEKTKPAPPKEET